MLSLSPPLSFKNSLDSWLGQKAAVQSRTEYPSRREDKVSRLSQGHQHWQLLKVWQVLRISALNFLEVVTSLCEPVGWSVSWSACQNILKEREVILDKCSYRSTYQKYCLAFYLSKGKQYFKILPSLKEHQILYEVNKVKKAWRFKPCHSFDVLLRKCQEWSK